MVGLADIAQLLATFAADFDAADLSGAEALRGVRRAATIKNIASTIEALCSARVEETAAHTQTGDRSAAHVLARIAGTTVGQAKERVQTAKRLAKRPKLADAARKGEVSPEQSSTIADAAEADPGAEQKLLDGVREGATLAETRDEAARLKAAAHPDPEERRRNIHRERYLRSFTDREGGWNLHVRNNPEVGAGIMARLDEITDEIFHLAYREGRREPREAYAADALARLAAGDCKAPKGSARPKVIFRVDWAAYLRGYPTEGELMELVGFGPVAASAVDEALAAGGFVAAVITKGEVLTGVAHLGRAPTAKQQTALEWLYPTCAAQGCFAVARLERDHRIDWADTKVTMLDWLDLLCSHHHDLKTRLGWKLVEGTGKRAFVPPDDPRHPDNANAPPQACS
jgi:hypothetical protein